MTYVNYVGGLRRQYHHIKTNLEDSETYEPAMVIIHEKYPGVSFIIPISAFWKYVEPIDNVSGLPSDMEAFMDIVNKAMWRRKVSVAFVDKEKARWDLQACMFASALWERNKILPCTGWNLAKMMQMFGIAPKPEAAAQLLLWIQDGLEDLKNMPELPPEEELVGGEVELWEGGKKIASKDLTVKESDLIIEGGKEGEA
jgi:hypothetical protein